MTNSISIVFRALSTWPTTATPSAERKASPFQASWSKTVDLLETELSKIGARNVVIEADCDPSEVRIDGHLRANARLRGPGVVLSFECRNGALRFPCDRFTDWQANVRAIALSLEALRTVDRYGVTRRAEQYKGWAALPDMRAEQKIRQQIAAEHIVQQCWSLRITGIPTVEQMVVSGDVRRDTYKRLAKLLHPDVSGGDDKPFKQLQEHFAAFEA